MPSCRPFSIRRTSSLPAALLTLCAFALCTGVPPAEAALAGDSTVYAQCAREVTTGLDISDCQRSEGEGAFHIDVPHPTDPLPSGLEECAFQFFSYDGSIYLSESFDPHVELDIEAGSHTEGVAWYHCSSGAGGGCEPGQPCPRTLTAIDLSAHSVVTQRFVESTSPATAIGLCTFGSPCTTDGAYTLDGVVAMAELPNMPADLQFRSWLGGPAGERFLEAPSGVGIALYDLPKETCPDGWTLYLYTENRRCLRPIWKALDPYHTYIPWVADGATAADIVDVCEMDDQCTPCGDLGGCPWWDFHFLGDGVAERLDVRIYDALLDAIVAEGEPDGNGGLHLRFRPEFQGTLDPGRYYFHYLPIGDAPEDGWVKLRTRLSTGCQ